MSEPDPAPLTLRTPLTDVIVRKRWLLWCTLIVVYAFAFTGQWRVGRDSALYRGLAHSIASGRGYTFGEFGSRQVYPGLPVLLAGIEKIFGLSAWPGILVMHAMALGCLVFTYKLVRLRYPEWVAVWVTFAVGMNGWFIELANELLTDIPFLLGVMIALYGWERLRIELFDPVGAERKRRSMVAPLVYLVVGLALAAVMRPTFWVLAIAWVIVCVWGLIAGPKRRFYAISLGVLFVVWLAVAISDPRVRGFRPLQGGYERDARRSVAQAGANIRKNLPDLTGHEMNYAFFGQKWWPGGGWVHGIYVPGFTDVMSVLVIGAALLLWRVNPLWTLVVFLTVIVTLVMTVVPRYYVMVLPLLALAWFALAIEVTHYVPPRWAEVVLLAAFLTLIPMNLIRAIRVIGEQHAWNSEDEEGPPWQNVRDMGEEVRRLVPPGEKVIAPGASIMAFVSDRECVMQRDILPTNKSALHYPEHIAALNIHYAVFPSRWYRKGDRIVRDLMDRGVIVPVERVAKVGEMALARIEIKVPPPGVDWRKQPVTTAPMTVRSTAGGTTRPSAQVLAAKKRQVAAKKKVLAIHKAQLEAKLAKAKRKANQQAAARAAAKKRKAKRNNPATTNAATRPVSSLLTPPSRNRDYFPDVGGFSGQSSASRSDSICSRVNFRVPLSIP